MSELKDQNKKNGLSIHLKKSVSRITEINTKIDRKIDSEIISLRNEIIVKKKVLNQAQKTPLKNKLSTNPNSPLTKTVSQGKNINKSINKSRNIGEYRQIKHSTFDSTNNNNCLPLDNDVMQVIKYRTIEIKNDCDPDDNILNLLLKNLDMIDYTEIFEINKISFQDLFNLTNDDYKEMNIPIGPKSRIMKFVKDFQKNFPKIEKTSVHNLKSFFENRERNDFNFPEHSEEYEQKNNLNSPNFGKNINKFEISYNIDTLRIFNQVDFCKQDKNVFKKNAKINDCHSPNFSFRNHVYENDIEHSNSQTNDLNEVKLENEKANRIFCKKDIKKNCFKLQKKHIK